MRQDREEGQSSFPERTLGSTGSQSHSAYLCGVHLQGGTNVMTAEQDWSAETSQSSRTPAKSDNLPAI
jgi:hypothetical protein